LEFGEGKFEVGDVRVGELDGKYVSGC